MDSLTIASNSYRIWISFISVWSELDSLLAAFVPLANPILDWMCHSDMRDIYLFFMSIWSGELPENNLFGGFTGGYGVFFFLELPKDLLFALNRDVSKPLLLG
jgi:hypothetical protein